MNRAIIHFDGGCEPNPGAKYGSCSIVFDEVFQLDLKRQPFGHGTNNEAEFDALIMALKLLDKSCIKAAVAQKAVTVEIFTDSRIVWNWIKQFYAFQPKKNTDERRLVMHGLAKQAIEILKGFASYEISWNSRVVNLEKFGH